VTIEGRRLSARTINLQGKEIDAFEIRKGANGSLDKDYLARAVPEEEFGALRALVAPSLSGLALSDDPRSGKPVKVKLDLGAGERAMKFTLKLERRAERDWEMTPASGEAPAGGTVPLEMSIRLREPAKFADPQAAPAVLRLECVFEIGGKQASVFSNRLAYKPPEPPDAPGAPDAGKKDEEK